MKKSIKFLFAAIAVLAVASCAKEQLETPQTGLRTIGVAFSEETTKTTLNEYSPVWASGDTLWLSNGTDVEKVGVPAEAVGAKYFTFQTSLEGSLYMVYPYAAAKSVTNGAVTVNVPAIQDGTFGSANICVGKVGAGNDVTLKNVTSVMKITVDSDLMPVQTVCLNAMGNAIAGTCDVTFDDENVKVASNGTGTGVSIEVNGLSGVYYASVIPGKYEAGFAMTAVSTDLSVETKTSTLAQKIELNNLVNMGSIGSNLKPLSGTGTEGDPYTINNLGEWLALTYYVNNGNDMAGQYVKVTADISGITQPVGIRVGDDQKPFSGNVDGGDHTLTVDIDGANCQAKDRIGLFGLTYGATIQNVKVAGKVTSKGSYIGGVAGVANNSTASQKTVFKNCKNSADVTGATCSGGIVGWIGSAANLTVTIENCTNSGAITSTGNYAGGIVGYSQHGNNYYKTISACSNSGAVKATQTAAGIVGYAYYILADGNSNEGSVTTTVSNNGTYFLNGSKWATATGYNNGVGGISGYAQNCTIDNCKNSGAITGVNKVGGIAGANYWTEVKHCNNSGEIVSTSTSAEPSTLSANPGSASMSGGIVGWILTSGNVKYCDNTGSVSGGVYVGGIVGFLQSGNTNNNIVMQVDTCANKAKISGSRGVGGIVGRTWNHLGAKFTRCLYDVNEGEIVATDRAAAGIIGISYDSNGVGAGYVNVCLNKGNVTAPLYAGGIVGVGQTRLQYKTGAVTINNCENRGTVAATRTTDYGECSGGIMGSWETTGATGGGAKIYNCNNKGDVLYATASHVKPYCGGIIGRFQYGDMKNCYNSGKVGPEDGSTPAEGAEKLLGALVGSLENSAVVNYAYYLETTCAQASGTNKVITSEAVASANADGVLSRTVTVNDVDFTNALDALNAWAGSSWKTWGAGFVLNLGL